MVVRALFGFVVVVVACGPAPGSGEGEETGTSGASESTTAEGVPTTGCDGADCSEACSPGGPCQAGWDCVMGSCVPGAPQPGECAGSVVVEALLRVDLPGEGPGKLVGAADLEGDGVLELFGARDRLWFVRTAELHPVLIPGERMVGEFAANVGDINGDGFLDLVPGAGRSVLIGDGLGGFVAAPGPMDGQYDVALGDLNGDAQDELVGLVPECPPDAGEDVECSGGFNAAMWLRHGESWEVTSFPTLLGSRPGDLLVADLLPGHAPVGVFALYDWGTITLRDFDEHASSFGVPEAEHAKLVVVRRAEDDRAELARVSASDGFTWGARMRSGQHHLEVAHQWAVASEYRHVAAGDVDLDGHDDLVLVGEDLRVLIDRAELPGMACTLSVALDEEVGDVALADLDGGGHELIVATATGLAVYSLVVAL